jgi:hypothetical protein
LSSVIPKRDETAGRAPRRRVLKAGVIAINDRRVTFACTVRNVSEAGAQLRTLAPTVAPDTFLLIIELDGIEADCEVTWRRNGDVGVKFLGPARKVAPMRTQSITPVEKNGPPSLRRKLKQA